MAADPKPTSEQLTAQATATAIGALAQATVAPPRGPKVERTIVRLKLQYGANMPGEVCGFAPEIAQQLVDMKAAEPQALKK